MREALQAYAKRVGELAQHVRGNEQSMKQSLVGPLFTILVDDLTNPWERIPEYRVDQRMGAAADIDRRPGQAGLVRTAVGLRGGGPRADRNDAGRDRPEN